MIETTLSLPGVLVGGGASLALLVFAMGRSAGRLVAVAFAVVASIVCAGLAVRVLVYRPLYAPGDPRRVPVEVVVPPGSPAQAIGEILAARGVVSSPTVFAFAARWRGVGGELRAGRYALARGLSVSEAIEALRQGGLSDDVVVTIPEGWTLRMIAARVAAAGLCDTEAFLRSAQGKEGYLFPDTYRFRPGAGTEEVIRAMERRFEEVCDSDLLAAAAERGLDRHGLVVLASIVEREAAVAEERPVIAGVYHNRLRRGMPLAADPTIVYALGKDWKAVVTYADLDVESPYNTYRRRGLPPGPIGAPGRGALEAAARPASHDLLYFVARADGTGRHDFARTAAEHERNRRAAKGRLARARSE